jgi:hypothetical protein
MNADYDNNFDETMEKEVIEEIIVVQNVDESFVESELQDSPIPEHENIQNFNDFVQEAEAELVQDSPECSFQNVGRIQNGAKNEKERIIGLLEQILNNQVVAAQRHDEMMERICKLEGMAGD